MEQSVCNIQLLYLIKSFHSKNQRERMGLLERRTGSTVSDLCDDV